MESSPRPNPSDSFGEMDGPARDLARASTGRMRWAVALLLFGLVVAFVPGLFAGNRFVGVIRMWVRSGNVPDVWIELTDLVHSHGHHAAGRYSGTSAPDLIRTHVEWALVAASLGLVPVLFVWWRRAGVGFARIGGAGVAVGAAASLIALVGSMRGLSDLPAGVWWTVPLGGALMAAAFLVAPAPRPRDDG